MYGADTLSPLTRIENEKIKKATRENKRKKEQKRENKRKNIKNKKW